MRGIIMKCKWFWLLVMVMILSISFGSYVWAEEKWYDQIDLGLSVAGLFQGVFNNDMGDKSYSAISVDLDMSREFSNADRAYLLLEMGSGRNPEQDVSSFAGIVDEALSMVPVATDDGDVRISQAWYEHDFAFTGGNAWLRFGKVDLTTDFDTNEYANDECAQFISPEFINNIAVEFPDYGFGIMLWMDTEDFSLGFGYADANADWQEIFDYPFFIGELDFHTNFLDQAGNYRFYAWYNGDKYTHQEILGNDYKVAYGFGVSFDQKLRDGVGVFFRYGWQNSNIHEFDNALSCGFSISGKFWNRNEDTVGIGIGVAFLSDDYEETLKDNGGNPDDEYHLEAYYSIKVNDSLIITPDIQWTDNPSGGLDYDNFWVLSTRVTWEF